MTMSYSTRKNPGPYREYKDTYISMEIDVVDYATTDSFSPASSRKDDVPLPADYFILPLPGTFAGFTFVISNPNIKLQFR